MIHHGQSVELCSTNTSLRDISMFLETTRPGHVTYHDDVMMWPLVKAAAAYYITRWYYTGLGIRDIIYLIINNRWKWAPTCQIRMKKYSPCFSLLSDKCYNVDTGYTLLLGITVLVYLFSCFNFLCVKSSLLLFRLLGSKNVQPQLMWKMS